MGSNNHFSGPDSRTIYPIKLASYSISHDIFYIHLISHMILLVSDIIRSPKKTLIQFHRIKPLWYILVILLLSRSYIHNIYLYISQTKLLIQSHPKKPAIYQARHAHARSPLRRSHSLMHGLWKMWPQGKRWASSPSAKSSKQIAQLPPASWWRVSNVFLFRPPPLWPNKTVGKWDEITLLTQDYTSL